MSRLRRVNRLCSRTLSDTANMSRHGSTLCSPTVEKLLCRSPYSAAVTCRQSAPDSPRERGDSQEGGNRRCLPSCAPARRQRTFPRSAERNSSLDFKRKTPRPLGANPPAAVRVPRSAGAEKDSRPSGANTPAAVRVPRSAGAEKSCRPERMNRLRGSSAPEVRCRNQKAAPFSECCSELRMLTRF